MHMFSSAQLQSPLRNVIKASSLPCLHPIVGKSLPGDVGAHINPRKADIVDQRRLRWKRHPDESGTIGYMDGASTMITKNNKYWLQSTVHGPNQTTEIAVPLWRHMTSGGFHEFMSPIRLVQ